MPQYDAQWVKAALRAAGLTQVHNGLRLSTTNQQAQGRVVPWYKGVRVRGSPPQDTPWAELRWVGRLGTGGKVHIPGYFCTAVDAAYAVAAADKWKLENGASDDELVSPSLTLAPLLSPTPALTPYPNPNPPLQAAQLRQQQAAQQQQQAQQAAQLERQRQAAQVSPRA